MSTMPNSSQTRRSILTKACSAGAYPMREGTRSMTMPATLFACSRSTASATAASLKGMTTVSSSTGTREALRAGHDRRRVGDLRVVVGAVVQALALHDLGALGQRAGRLDGVHHGLGAAAAENDPLGARHPEAQVLGEQDLGPLGHPEADPAVQLLLQGGYGGRVPVTVDEHHEVVGAVQQGVAVDVADPAAEPRMNV